MSTKSLLTREEITLLRMNHLQTIHREYREVVHTLNLIADALKSIDGDDLYLSGDDQVRLLRKMGRNVLDLEAAVKELRLYLQGVATRLKVA